MINAVFHLLFGLFGITLKGTTFCVVLSVFYEGWKMISASVNMESFFTPLYHELKERLEDEILSSGLSDGSFFCTLKDICERHEVSITTARKAVDALQKSGVVRSKSSRGIYVVDTGKLLDQKSLKNYVLIFHAHEAGSQSVYFSLRLGSMLEAFAENGITAKVIFRKGGIFPSFNISQDAVRGIVVSSITPLDEVQRYARLAPTLILGGHNVSMPDVYQITYNIGKRAELAAKYFLDNGKERIVFISHDEEEISEYSAALKKLRHITFSVLNVAAPNMESGRECVAQLADLPSSTGIMAGDDAIAVGIVDAFLKRGHDLREEKRIVALANPRFPFTRQYGIPVVGSDPWGIGRTAAEFLCTVIKGENPEKRRSITIEPEISWEYEK